MQTSRIISLLAVCLWGSTPLFGNEEFGTVTAKIPRGDSSYLQLIVTLANVPFADLVAEGSSSVSNDKASALMVANLDVCIVGDTERHTDSNETCPKKILYQSRTAEDRTPSSDLTERYYMNIMSIELVPDDTGTLYDVTVELKIEGQSTVDESNNEVIVSFAVDDAVQINYDSESADIAINATAIAATPVGDEPEGLGVAGQNKGIVVYWSDDYNVNFADESEGNADGVRAYLIPLTSSSLSLNITSTYDANSADANLDDCTLSAVISGPDSETGNTCSFTCNSLGYLNSARVSDDLNITVKDTSSAGAISFSGDELLDPDDTTQAYAALIQFLPDGLLQENNGIYQASCAVGYSKRSFTYAQLNGAGEPKERNPTCFIATAAYGHPLHSALHELRWFRDEVLLNYNWGRKFVDYYYQWSPQLAKDLALHEPYKAVVRGLLWVPVKAITIYRQGNGLLLVLSLSFLGLGSILWWRRQRTT